MHAVWQQGADSSSQGLSPIVSFVSFPYKALSPDLPAKKWKVLPALCLQFLYVCLFCSMTISGMCTVAHIAHVAHGNHICYTSKSGKSVPMNQQDVWAANVLMPLKIKSNPLHIICCCVSLENLNCEKWRLYFYAAGRIGNKSTVTVQLSWIIWYRMGFWFQKISPKFLFSFLFFAPRQPTWSYSRCPLPSQKTSWPKHTTSPLGQSSLTTCWPSSGMKLRAGRHRR